MVPYFREYHKPVRPWFIYMLIVMLAVIFALFWINPMYSRSFIYGLFRELAKTEMSVKTWNWNKAESEHFVVKYKDQDKNIAQMVLNNAEKNFRPVSEKFGFYPKQKTQVIIYPTRESLSKSFGWDANESAMGVYWAGVIRILSPNEWISSGNSHTMENTFDSKGPMAHEYTHLVVDYLTRGNYPRWFTEGVAQYNELIITGFKLPNDDMSMKKLYPLAEMDDNFDNLPDQALAYRESLVAIKFLVDNYGQDKLILLMTELGKGYSMDKALEKAIGVDLSRFENNWHSWLRDNIDEMN